MKSLVFPFFFFSSRRRHTRCYRDWSSDVCSSDLRRPALLRLRLVLPRRRPPGGCCRNDRLPPPAPQLLDGRSSRPLADAAERRCDDGRHVRRAVCDHRIPGNIGKPRALTWTDLPLPAGRYTACFSTALATSSRSAATTSGFGASGSSTMPGRATKAAAQPACAAPATSHAWAAT